MKLVTLTAAMKLVTLTAAAVLALTPCVPAQMSPAAAAAAPHSVRTFHVTYATSQAEQNEILTAIRNIVTANMKIFLVASTGEVVCNGTAEDLALVADLLSKLDQPHKQYRLTYTFTEMDGGKRIGVQRYAMVVAAGQRTLLKEGSRVPLITGSLSAPNTGLVKQSTYIDVGLSFDSTLQEHGAGFQLKSRVEQSSIAEEKPGVGPDDPVIRQTLLEGVSILPEGKAVSLGSLDVLGSTRHLDVQVTVDAIK